MVELVETGSAVVDEDRDLAGGLTYRAKSTLLRLDLLVRCTPAMSVSSMTSTNNTLEM